MQWVDFSNLKIQPYFDPIGLNTSLFNVSGVLRVQIVTAYIELVGIIIGFYFGLRAAETKIKKEETEVEAKPATPEEGEGGT